MEFVFDSSEKGLGTVMKDYQVICMRFLWEKREEGSNSRKAWLYINKIFREEEKTISRASVINFLNAMVDNDILRYIEETGKGGYHRIYYPIYDEAGFKEHLATQVIEKLMEEFPEETDKAIIKITNEEGSGHAEAQGQPGPHP